MIIPAEVDLFLRRNDNPFYMRVNVFENNAPLNMISYLMRMQIRRYKGAAGAPDIQAFSIGVGNTSRIITGNGYWELYLTKTDIDNLPRATKNGETRVMYYDILVTDGIGNENAWYEGKVYIDPGVTA